MRRTKPEKREVFPDVRYNSLIVSNLINRIMSRGKKSVATRMIYDALEIVSKKSGKDAIEVLDQAIRNVGPVMEVRPRRVGGATYQVPMEVPSDRRLTLAMRWIIDASRSRKGRPFADSIAEEILDASANQGPSVKKREDTHKMAEANRAFSHYRM